jgi:LuxR family maltose regulon positive regulatory protein
VPEVVEREAAERAQLAIAMGDIPAAVRWADTCGLSAEDQKLSFQREPAYLALARVRIAQCRGDPGGLFVRDAERLLEQLLADAVAKGRGHSVLEILVLRALAQRARRDLRGALGTLARALTLAQPEGYVRLFADEGAPMASLLTDLIEATAQRQLAVPADVLHYAHALVAACRSQDGSVPAPSAPLQPSAQTPEGWGATQSHLPPGVPPLLDPLTERELEVLHLLVDGASNAAIAARLVVTVGTVKKHVHNVCSKLGAQNRTQAIARARALRLL